MRRLFLSYRRADAPDAVRLIYDRLSAGLPNWEIFYDHESIPPAAPFPAVLRESVTAADVVLVLIGPRWLDLLRERAAAGGTDHAREEVRLALGAGHAVVPVAVGRARLPAAADLADFPDIARLAGQHGLHVRPDPDLEADAAHLLAAVERVGPGEGPGTVLDGRYKLVREVGAGGMGVVYLAEQAHPWREVAVKLVKPGMDSREVLARFEAEREALGRMSHPNIARAVDAGTTPAGRPFFVMEYVRGVPITRYCDEHKLTVAGRLELFRQVCDAVQHAHQKGVIHRDVKPSNVLVEDVGRKPVPKVIDFGLAKALGGRLADRTLYTDLRAFVGTLEYASPEQAEGKADIDTRTDVYSLGALLYELLSGSPPFTAGELGRAGEAEALRLVRESDPPRLSARLSSAAGLHALAEKRRSDPARLTREVRGELDWIVAKGLEKERDRRYQTAAAFADDVARYLNNEPITAGRPSAVHRLRKFVRRNRGPVFAVGVIVAGLALGVAGTTMGLLSARDAERAALKARDDQAAAAADADRARAAAEAETRNATAATDYLVDLFRVSDPEQARGRAVTARELLDWNADRVTRGLEDQPLLQARLMDALGTVFRNLGQYDRARPLLERALDVRVRVLGPGHPDVAVTAHNLAELWQATGDHVPAAAGFRQAVEIRRKALGDRHPDVARSLTGLAAATAAAGRYAEAKSLYGEAIRQYRDLLGERHPAYVAGLDGLARVHIATGEFAAAAPLLRQVVEFRKVHLGADHPEYAGSLRALGNLYRVMGDLARAEPLLGAAAALDLKVFGPGHPVTAAGLTDLGLLYHDLDRTAEARGQLMRAAAIRKEVFGEDSVTYAASLYHLGCLEQAAGRPAEARDRLQDALVIRERALGRDHPDTAAVRHRLGTLALAAGDADRAERLLAETARVYREKYGGGHPETGRAVHDLGAVYFAKGDVRQAAALMQEALRVAAHNLRSAAGVQSERQQLAAAGGARAQFESYLVVALSSGLPPETAYPHFLTWKGAVSARRWHLRAARDRPEIAQLQDQLERETGRLAALAYSPPETGKDRSAWVGDLEAAAERRDGLEMELARRASEAGAVTLPEPGLGQLQAVLPADAALVDLFEYTAPALGDRAGAPARKIAAFVVRRGSVVLIDLGPVDLVREAVHEARTWMRPETKSLPSSNQLRKVVWEPLDPHLGGVQTVLISPDGITHQIPWLALPGRKTGTYLIEDVSVVIAPVPQLLAHLLGPSAGSDRHEHSLLLIGGLDFDRGEQRFTFPRLPGTEVEIDEIAALYAAGTRAGRVLRLAGPEATKAVVRRELPRHSSAHFATHGFRPPIDVRDHAPTGLDRTRGGLSRVPAPNLIFDPDMLAGLALSGANRKPKPGEEANILTALEIAELDLRRVDLVVLSACETSSGKVVGGQGVYGLHRAFQTAGVRTVIAASGVVDDDKTIELMRRLYANLLRGLPRGEALRQAQLSMLRGPETAPGGKPTLRGPVVVAGEKTERSYRHPYYWSQFMLYGEWR